MTFPLYLNVEADLVAVSVLSLRLTYLHLTVGHGAVLMGAQYGM